MSLHPQTKFRGIQFPQIPPNTKFLGATSLRNNTTASLSKMDWSAINASTQAYIQVLLCI